MIALAIAFAAGLSLMFTTAAWRARAASIITVTSGGDSGPGTLREAITVTAVDGDTIKFDPSLSTITLTSGQITLDKNLSIEGPGANLLTVRRNSSASPFRIFEVSSGKTVSLSGLTIAGGSSGGGGGILNSGVLTISSSAVSGNSANLSAGVGGGIYNAASATLTISDGAVSGNFSTGHGGGIENNGTLTISNSTVSGNSATSHSGGILNLGTLTISSSTLSGNSAVNGGGMTQAGVLDLNGSIVANNTASFGPDIVGPVMSGDHNLIEDTSKILIFDRLPGSNNITGVDPLLGPLAFNGGPTQTHALLAGSPAIDTGACAGIPGADQRGVSRPQGPACDIGAFEKTPTFNFSGFFAPVDNPPLVNVAKAGTAIPVKFSLGGDQGLGIFAPSYPTSQQLTCSSADPAGEIEETVTAGASSLSYDSTTEQYTYVWKTNAAWRNTCRRLVIKLNDGTTHTANFRFR
jgi:hypothetical protein